MIPSASACRTLSLEVADRCEDASRSRTAAMALRLLRARRAEVGARRRLEGVQAAVAARSAASAPQLRSPTPAARSTS